MLWALLDALKQRGHQVQSFRSRAELSEMNACDTITGRVQRHVDARFMTADACRQVFAHGASDADIAVVDGAFRGPNIKEADSRNGYSDQGDFDAICDWLDLSRVAVVDASVLDSCVLPKLPSNCDAFLLDGACSRRHLTEMQTNLEALFGVPMLGGLVRDLQVDMAIENCLARQRFCPQLANYLGKSLLRSWQTEVFHSITQRDGWENCGTNLFSQHPGQRPSVLAMAYDEAFFEYCPETLEMLEASGVLVETFSPLHDAELPPDTDLLFIGSGRMADYAQKLSQNYCIRSAICNFVGRGGRVWAELDGLAYLCQQAVLQDGQRLSMAGILPAVAHANGAPGAPEPVEIPIQCDTWLAPAGAVVRGYRDTRWEVQPTTGDASLSEARSRNDLLGSRRVIGSRVALSLAIQPKLLESFARSSAMGLC